MLWQRYILPTSIQSALQILSESPAPTRIIAGGTDLILDLRQGRHPPVNTIIDVTGIPELQTIELRGEYLFIGAAVPLVQIIASQLVHDHAMALVDACQLIAGPQVRNVATLGGNVAHALPAADGTIALMCLGTTVEIVNQIGQKRVPLENLFGNFGKSKLVAGKDLLVGFYIPYQLPGQGSAFTRIMRAQGISLPILNLSIWMEKKEDHVIQTRIACGPAGPVPRRLILTEKSLSGVKYTRELINNAISILLEEVSFRTSPHRATENYRKHLAGILLKKTMDCVWNRINE